MRDVLRSLNDGPPVPRADAAGAPATPGPDADLLGVPDDLLDKAFTTYARHKDAGESPAWAVRHALAAVMTDLALAADIAGLAATLRATVTDFDALAERRAQAIAAPLIEQARQEAADAVVRAAAEVERERDVIAELRRRIYALERRVGQLTRKESS